MENPRKILVVDDDPSLHQIVGQIAVKRGWSVETATNCSDAWDQLLRQRFDLVVAGAGIPGPAGMELLTRIQRETPGLPVIVTATASTPDRVIGALRGRAFAYFSKPVAVSALADAMCLALAPGAGSEDILVLSAVPHWISLRVRARIENADRVTQFLREVEVELDPHDREQIATAFRELLLNAIEHGSGADPDKWVWVSYVRTAREIVYYIRDQGQGFSIGDLRHAAVAHPPGIAHMDVREQRGLRPGGFGLLLVRKMADEVIYNEKGNEVLLVKYLNGRG